MLNKKGKISEIIQKDIYRYYGNEKKWRINPTLKYIKVYRKANFYKDSKFNFLKYYYILRLNQLSRRYLIQIPYTTKIGEGLYIGHMGSIVINPKAVLGKNINIAKGVTIGQTNRGSKKGTPKIGNEVWIGTNAVVVGKIIIGDDVLIAPNAYVNFDIPSHSIVIGNPGKIISKEDATKEYINRKV